LLILIDATSNAGLESCAEILVAASSKAVIKNALNVLSALHPGK